MHVSKNCSARLNVPLDHSLLQCFDTVGWVIRPVKTVGRITYIVLVQTLNHAQSIKPTRHSLGQFKDDVLQV